jgi:PRTRC genetic system protein C
LKPSLGENEMAVTIQKLERTFLFNGAKLPDPNPEFSVEQVRDIYVNTYPELATAAIEGPTPASGTMQYVFTRAVGAKG